MNLAAGITLGALVLAGLALAFVGVWRRALRADAAGQPRAVEGTTCYPKVSR